MKKIVLAAVAAIIATLGLDAKGYRVVSPDGAIEVNISVGSTLTWSVAREGVSLVAPSPLSLTLEDGTVLGHGSRISKAKTTRIDAGEDTPLFKRASIRNQCNQLTLSSKRFDLVFRAYNDGVAYRWITKKAETVKAEEFRLCLPEDWSMWVPYVLPRDTFEGQFFQSSENTYVKHAASAWESGRIAFMPITVDAVSGIKLCITEADLLNYPGMYLYNSDGDSTLEGVFPRYPKDVEQGGHNLLQGIVKTREDYIYKGSAGEALPWRVVIVATQDKELAESDMVFRLAKSPEGDFSWVKPGKVAWDWWNDWNLYGVDFVAGINNETYKYYIDFASSHGIEYVILDEGWAVNLKADLLQVVPAIDLPMLASYARERNVGLILWAGYWAFNRDMENVCKHYEDMGIAGWKIDFMDRDDQQMVDFYVRAAEVAAKHHQVVDFHGAYKPTGLNKTYPNILNFEGVHGLEQLKWGDGYDMPEYDCTIPFTRLVAGPADYTQGAMRNATRENYRPVNSEGMSMGTRTHQLAEYIIFDAPLTMLCDSPSNYMREEECTEFIASCPTVWDETVALDGKIGEYVVIARRSGSVWYVGAICNWTPRDIDIDLAPLGIEAADVTLFRDGVNAHHAARDYKKESFSISDGHIRVHLAPGGGAAAIIR